jgi:hypothetical protein
MSNESPDDYDHEVKSVYESLIKLFWALLFGIGWFGAILHSFLYGDWYLILFMIPVSFLYYYVLIKKDAISRW